MGQKSVKRDMFQFLLSLVLMLPEMLLSPWSHLSSQMLPRGHSVQGHLWFLGSPCTSDSHGRHLFLPHSHDPFMGISVVPPFWPSRQFLVDGTQDYSQVSVSPAGQPGGATLKSHSLFPWNFLAFISLLPSPTLSSSLSG